MRNRLKKELGAAAKPEKEDRNEETGDIALVWLVDPGHYRSEKRRDVLINKFECLSLSMAI